MLYSQSLILNCARLPIDAMYNKFITRIADRIHARNCRPCLANTNSEGGRGGETIPSGKEERVRTSFINICVYW